MTWSKPPTQGVPPPVSTFPAVFAMGRHLFIMGGGRLEATYVSDNISVLDTGNALPIIINLYFSFHDMDK